MRVAEDALSYANRELARQKEAGGRRRRLATAARPGPQRRRRGQVAPRRGPAAGRRRPHRRRGRRPHRSAPRRDAGPGRPRPRQGCSSATPWSARRRTASSPRSSRSSSAATSPAPSPCSGWVSGRPYIEADFKVEPALQDAHRPTGRGGDRRLFRPEVHRSRRQLQAPAPARPFSILPPQNATGNWVKVVQRLPVRIEFDQTTPQIAAAGLLGQGQGRHEREVRIGNHAQPAATRGLPTSGRSPSASCWRRSWSPSTPPSPTSALPHIQGSVSASQDQITWVLTSYIVASTIMTPMTGWLSGRIGRKQVFLFSIIGFTNRLGPVRHGRQPVPDRALPPAPGPVRRGPDPPVAGGAARHLPQ